MKSKDMSCLAFGVGLAVSPLCLRAQNISDFCRTHPGAKIITQDQNKETLCPLNPIDTASNESPARKNAGINETAEQAALADLTTLSGSLSAGASESHFLQRFDNNTRINEPLPVDAAQGPAGGGSSDSPLSKKNSKKGFGFFDHFFTGAEISGATQHGRPGNGWGGSAAVHVVKIKGLEVDGIYSKQPMYDVFKEIGDAGPNPLDPNSELTSKSYTYLKHYWRPMGSVSYKVPIPFAGLRKHVELRGGVVMGAFKGYASALDNTSVVDSHGNIFYKNVGWYPTGEKPLSQFAATIDGKIRIKPQSSKNYYLYGQYSYAPTGFTAISAGIGYDGNFIKGVKSWFKRDKTDSQP